MADSTEGTNKPKKRRTRKTKTKVESPTPEAVETTPALVPAKTKPRRPFPLMAVLPAAEFLRQAAIFVAQVYATSAQKEQLRGETRSVRKNLGKR